MNQSEPPPIVCDLTVFSEEERTSQLHLARVLLEGDVEELDDGLAFHYPAQPGIVERLGAYIEHERRCCRFMSFQLLVPPAGRNVSLTVRAPERGRDLLKEGLELLRRNMTDEETLAAWSDHDHVCT